VNRTLRLGRAGHVVARFLLGATATVAMPIAMFATPATASATIVLTGHLCETNGNFCVGSTSLDLSSAVSERNPGRTLDLVDQNRAFEGDEIYKIRFHADRTKCVASANDLSRVVIHPCDGVGVDWAKDPNANRHLRFINREATIALNSNQYLAGFNDGGDYALEPLGLSGVLYAFDLV
jgi:hypothetical protein